jgi:hypothetical protein
VLLSVVAWVTRDLNQQQRASMKVSQEPMQQLLKRMQLEGDRLPEDRSPNDACISSCWRIASSDSFNILEQRQVPTNYSFKSGKDFG